MRDVIVIGAGGGGPVVAKELAARGLDVLILEAGPRFADPETEWTHYEIDANGGYFRFGPVDLSKPAWFRDLPQNSVLQQLSGVGGTTLHYFGNSPRAVPGVFLNYDGSDRDNYDTAHVFPFSYPELIPYYEWVEYTLPVQTAPMGTKEEVFLRGAERFGLPVQTTKDITKAAFRPQENAILQPGGYAGKTDDPKYLRYPHSQGCTFCGHCMQGCYLPRGAPRNLKAKRSTDNSYMPMALTADQWAPGKAATLITDAFAVKITTDEQNIARSVTWRVGRTGERVTEEAKVIVLAAGNVETPRLWLNSSLPNPNDQVGRGFTDHFSDALGGILPFRAGNSKGPGSNARVDFPGYGAMEQFVGTPAFAASSATLSDAGIAGYYNNGLPDPGSGADVVGRLVGRELRMVMSDIDRVLILVILTDDDVESQNRVTQSPAFPPDEHGPIPRIEIHQRTRTVRTLRNREFLAKQAVALLRAAGAIEVYRFNFPPTMIHVQSTMRMGLDVRDTVVEESGEARWVKRLFIADNSALANSLGGANPTLTTQALATRTAEKIFQSCFGGDPWVQKESPVSSTADTVTRADSPVALGAVQLS
jgi:choline dehydrogenase-like flavoprotein